MTAQLMKLPDEAASTCPCPTCGAPMESSDFIFLPQGLFFRGQRVYFQLKERRVLGFLWKNLGKVVSAQSLYNELYWDKGASFGEIGIHVIQVYISKCRRRIKERGLPLEILTIVGEGYQLKRKTQ